MSTIERPRGRAALVVRDRGGVDVTWELTDEWVTRTSLGRVEHLWPSTEAPAWACSAVGTREGASWEEVLLAP